MSLQTSAQNSLYVFPTALGWMAMIMVGSTVKQLTFGHASAYAARAALSPQLSAAAILATSDQRLVQRLEAYAQGAVDDFLDVECDPGRHTAFQERVLQACRRIPYGETRTYGDLALEAGTAGGARAVGNCMAANPIPLIIPCHRVVPSSGLLGGYSAPAGIPMKQRLLEMESAGAAACAHSVKRTAGVKFPIGPLQDSARPLRQRSRG